MISYSKVRDKARQDASLWKTLRSRYHPADITQLNESGSASSGIPGVAWNARASYAIRIVRFFFILATAARSQILFRAVESEINRCEKKTTAGGSTTVSLRRPSYKYVANLSDRKCAPEKRILIAISTCAQNYTYTHLYYSSKRIW